MSQYVHSGSYSWFFDFGFYLIVASHLAFDNSLSDILKDNSFFFIKEHLTTLLVKSMIWSNLNSPKLKVVKAGTCDKHFARCMH